MPGERRQQKTMRVERPALDLTAPAARDRCSLVMLTGPTPGAVQPVGADGVVLGRDPTLPAFIDDPGISNRHARVFCFENAYWIEDLGSTNGTTVGGATIQTARRLDDGDRIQLGANTLIRVALHDATEQEAAQRMYQAAVRDPLTGVFNRGHLEAALTAEFAYAVRHRHQLSLLFVDLDHFREVNNKYGHQAGDHVLRSAAEAMQRAIRLEDVLARYGGEEFVLVARGISLQQACILGERLRLTLSILSIPFNDETIKVTASVGVATYDARLSYSKVEELVAAADRAVYRAKSLGRNRVCSAEQTE